MTYLQFLAIFLGGPLVLCMLLFRRALQVRFLLCLAAVSVIAVVYTGPWDNAIVANGVWSYSRSQVLGTLIGRVPIEEYAFYVLQVFLVGTIAILIRRRA